MIKVGLFHVPRMESFHGYSIDSLDPANYFRKGRLANGAAHRLTRLGEAKWIDEMYRNRDADYMRFVGDFVDKFRDADLVVLATYNPIHPEILYEQLRKPIKVLGFVDDPISSYVRGIPYLWAFDGAFHISPSFNETTLFPNALELWGCGQSHWWPLVPPKFGALTEADLWPLAAPRAKALQAGDRFFKDRDIEVIYIGKQYGQKVDRLIKLKKHFGSRFRVYGRWAMAGWGGAARWLKGKPALWSRVKAISDEEKTSLYCRSKIGFNMHFSEVPRETGNMRMYEVPAHGAMLLCDKAGLNAHERIFEPGKEAIFYDSIEDAIEKIEYYLDHDEEREKIARVGFARLHRDYDGETKLKNFLDWASALPKKEASCQV